MVLKEDMEKQLTFQEADEELIAKVNWEIRYNIERNISAEDEWVLRMNGDGKIQTQDAFYGTT